MTLVHETLTDEPTTAFPYEALMANPTARELWNDMEPLSSQSDTDPARRAEFYSVVERTPLLKVPREALPEDVRNSGSTVVLKYEGAQVGGAYKARGNMNAQQRLDPATTVVEASTGNHANTGQVVASRLGRAAVRVESTKDIAPPKRLALVANGADLHPVHDTLPEALQTAKDLSKLPGSRFIHPYNDLDVVAGQGTVMLEAAEQLEEMGLEDGEQTVFCPGAGGGVAAGNAVATAAVLPGAEFRVSQMDGAQGIVAALQGWQLDPENFDRSCDGAAVPVPGELPMKVISDPNFVDGVDVVSKGAVGEAMAVAARIHRVPEPAGALALAAALQYMRAHPRDPEDSTNHVLLTVTSGVMVSPDKVTEFMQAAYAEGRVTGLVAYETVSRAHSERMIAGVDEVLADRDSEQTQAYLLGQRAMRVAASALPK